MGVEDKCSPLFDSKTGRPAKPIRRMVALLILKHMRNLSNESLVEPWSENGHYQYFSGEKFFAAARPCDASEWVHFRHRIGEQRIELILKESILRINGKDGHATQVSMDTAVQEKNITYLIVHTQNTSLTSALLVVEMNTTDMPCKNL